MSENNNNCQTIFDFSRYGTQEEMRLIPANTIAKVKMQIRPGGYGEGGYLKLSKNSDCKMLDCIFIVLDGPYQSRRIYQNIIISGGKTDSNGISIASKLGMNLLRDILESARGHNLSIDSWGEFDGLNFLARIGIQKDKTGNWHDKNKIIGAILSGDGNKKRIASQSLPKPAWA